MRALSIRQPYAEQILRGVKRIEYRSTPTNIIGERFYIYAARQPGPAEAFAAIRSEPGGLSTGVIVGSAIITRCTGKPGAYEWHLADVKRLKRPLRPKGKPQPIWFQPY